jgi:hypothetical protein
LRQNLAGQACERNVPVAISRERGWWSKLVHDGFGKNCSHGASADE